jgi:DNA replication initiation complex subunit (GINS family)
MNNTTETNNVNTTTSTAPAAVPARGRRATTIPLGSFTIELAKPTTMEEIDQLLTTREKLIYNSMGAIVNKQEEAFIVGAIRLRTEERPSQEAGQDRHTVVLVDQIARKLDANSLPTDELDENIKSTMALVMNTDRARGNRLQWDFQIVGQGDDAPKDHMIPLEHRPGADTSRPLSGFDIAPRAFRPAAREELKSWLDDGLRHFTRNEKIDDIENLPQPMKDGLRMAVTLLSYTGPARAFVQQQQARTGAVAATSARATGAVNNAGGQQTAMATGQPQNPADLLRARMMAGAATQHQHTAEATGTGQAEGQGQQQEQQQEEVKTEDTPTVETNTPTVTGTGRGSNARQDAPKVD